MMDSWPGRLRKMNMLPKIGGRIIKRSNLKMGILSKGNKQTFGTVACKCIRTTYLV